MPCTINYVFFYYYCMHRKILITFNAFLLIMLLCFDTFVHINLLYINNDNCARISQKKGRLRCFTVIRDNNNFLFIYHFAKNTKSKHLKCSYSMSMDLNIII